MPTNINVAPGWPVTNHAMGIRNETHRGPGRASIIHPRKKYTYVVQFDFAPGAIRETNLQQYINSGKLYASLRSIDHPKPRLTHEKLRSYNKFVLVPTKMEYEASNMAFHDDNTSMVAALLREYRSFYQYEGQIGAENGGNPTQGLNANFRIGTRIDGLDLISAMRHNMEARPSLGMTLRGSTNRHFFESIIIYDLGSDPSSVNVYVYINPVIVSVDHDNLDYEDRTGNLGISMSFEYEGYYHLVGTSCDLVSDALGTCLGTGAGQHNPGTGHASMTPSGGDGGVAGFASMDAVDGFGLGFPDVDDLAGSFKDRFASVPSTIVGRLKGTLGKALGSFF